MKDNHYKIIVPFYNVEKWIILCIRSIKRQANTNYQCVLIDDASTDGTVELVRKEIEKDARFTLFENKENVGALENIYNAINFCNPSDEDIIVNLDGDDWFSNANVLQVLDSYYSDDCLLTYGSHAIYPGGTRGKFCQRPVPKHIIDNKLFRESPWMTSALRTFKYKLWKRIKVEDLKNPQGSFYKTAWDLAYMFPMLEMAGHRSKFVKEIVYVYNQHDHNDHVVPAKRKDQLENEREIRGKEKYKTLVEYKTFDDGSYLVEEPKKLLTNLRFDVLAKTLYIRHKQKKAEDYIAKRVYEGHLEVWGGFTEKNPPKHNLQDFYDAFDEIYCDIQKNGFDKGKSVLPVDSNGNLLNGSHRLASSICLQKPVICKESPISAGQLDCSSFYFLNKSNVVKGGLNSELSDEMAIEFLRIHKEDVYMASVYEHCFQNLTDVYKIFQNNQVDIVYAKDFSLTESGKINYVISLYGDESWIGNIRNNLPGARQQSKLNFAKGNKVRAILLFSKNSENVVRAKKEIRELIGVGKPSVHITDTYEEAFRNATTCFHNPTLQFINNGEVGFFNEAKIKSFAQETVSIFRNSTLDREDYCIGGSAIFSVYGRRDFKDFDTIHLDSETPIPFTNRVSSHNDYLKYYAEEREKLIFDRSSYIYLHGIKFLSLEKIIKMKRNRGEQKDLVDIGLVQDFLEKRKKNVVILAAGPPKKDRNRHLEIFRGKPLIHSVIENCTIEGTNLFVVIDRKNVELIDYVRDSYQNVQILHPSDEKIRSTFKTALSVPGDCLMVVGDLTNFTKQDIEKFINTKHKSATCHYEKPWGRNVKSKDSNFLRRADVGDCMSLIAEEHKEEFLSDKNYDRASFLFSCFYPQGNRFKNMNEYWYNDVGTFTSFAFFENIWSKEGCYEDGGKGVVSFEHRIYEDND